jgi:hypothetical protein
MAKRIDGKKQFISGTDEYGYPMHSPNKDDAWKYREFSSVYAYIMLGYYAEKIYE